MINIEASRLAYVPAANRETFQRIASKRGDAVALIWTDARGLRGVAWIGNAQYPTDGGRGRGGVYRFNDQTHRAAWIKQVFRRAAAITERREEIKAAKKSQRAKPIGLQVGDVLRSSWGYEQTNIDYYQVTKVIGTQMVEIREIGQQRQETGFMTGDCAPVLNSFKSAPKRCRVSEYGARDSVKVNSCANAYKVEPTLVAGAKVYPVSNWSSYA